jgi:aspartate carbamoyltransferase catalytic subunit
MTAQSAADHRDFLAIPDYSRDELIGLFELAERMRSGEYREKPLAGKSLAMIFMKASTGPLFVSRSAGPCPSHLPALVMLPM